MTSLQTVYESIDPSEIDKWDHYIEIYANRLPNAGQPLKILEIGVQGGGSLKMWKKYFGRNSQIVGVDIDKRCLQFSNDDVTVIIGDQGDVEFLDRLIEEHAPFDVVIDDGSHVGKDQIASFKRLVHHVKHLYFVEDTHTSYWGAWQPISESFVNFAKGLIDDLHMYFIIANTSEVYGENEWKKIIGERDLGARRYLRSISFHDSLTVFEIGKSRPPIRRRRGSAPVGISEEPPKTEPPSMVGNS